MTRPRLWSHAYEEEARQVLGQGQKWAKAHEEFSDALNEGRALADFVIEDSLFNRAKGYRKRTVRKRKGPQGATVEETLEDVPPDTTACIYWLTF